MAETRRGVVVMPYIFELGVTFPYMTEIDRMSELEKNNVSILIADVKHYSEMDNNQLTTFFESLFPKVSDILNDNDPQDMNSWGDGIIAFFNDSISATDCALELRDEFRDRSWGRTHLPELEIRIALHSALVWEGYNPIRDEQGAVGSEINLTARVEPIVNPSNHIFVTKDFKQSVETIWPDDSIRFDPLTSIELAKNAGEMQLFNLRRSSDPKLRPEEVVTSQSDQETVDTQSDSERLASFFHDSNRVANQMRAVEILADRGSKDSIEILSDNLLAQDSIRGDVRARIAGRMDKIRDAEVIDPLRNAIESDPQMSVVNNAVASLKNLVGENVAGLETIDTFVKVVEDEENYSDRVRLLATRALGEFEDDRVTGSLVNIVEDPENNSGSLRREATEALGNVGDARTIDTLTKALDDPEEQVRGTAVEALGEIGDPEAIESLASIATQKEDTISRMRVAAIRSLTSFEDPKTIDPLLDATKDPDKEVRGAAIEALGEINAQKAKPRLKEIVKGGEINSSKVRSAAYLSLGKLGGQDAISTLIEGYENETDSEVREKICVGLGLTESPESIEKLTTILNDESEYTENRRTAALALEKIGRYEGIEVLIDVIDDSPPPVQRAALQAAATIGSPKAETKIDDILTSTDEYPQNIRQHAAFVARKLNNTSSALIHALTNDSSDRVVTAAALSISQINASDAIEELSNIANDSSCAFEPRLMAIVALGLISSVSDISYFTNIIEDENERDKLREEALIALTACGTATSQTYLQEMATEADEMTEMTIKAQRFLQKGAEGAVETLRDRIENTINDLERSDLE